MVKNGKNLPGRTNNEIKNYKRTRFKGISNKDLGQIDQATTSSTQTCDAINPMEVDLHPSYDNFQKLSGPLPTETNENMSMKDLWF
ncbi:hypothetical protein R6Q59_005562 [Mikania micrantha]